MLSYRSAVYRYPPFYEIERQLRAEEKKKERREEKGKLRREWCWNDLRPQDALQTFLV